MGTKHLQLYLAVVLITISMSCSGLKQGVGLKGTMIDYDLITLDDDTFRIIEHIGDSLLTVQNPSEEDITYLIKKESNGFYYVKAKGEQIYSIDYTTDYVLMGENNVYDWRNDRILFKHPCDPEYGLQYLGKWNDLLLFAHVDTLCFSDSKCIGLEYDVDYMPVHETGKVRLALGALSIEVTPEELYNYDRKKATKDSTTVHFKKDYLITHGADQEKVNSGISVDLELPKGNSPADIAIRDFIIKMIKDDAFQMLPAYGDIPTVKISKIDDVAKALEQYAGLWEKMFKHEFLSEEDDPYPMKSSATARKVVDCDDYVTYYYFNDVDGGGAHGLPRSFHITYDKRKNEFVTEQNTVKPTMAKKIRQLTLDALKELYDMKYDKYSMEGFKNIVSSLITEDEEAEDSDTVAEDQNEQTDPIPEFREYACDEWSGWENHYGKPTNDENFPLPHFAILPEGVSITYHPYQIDCFAAGEYNAFIPFEKVAACLNYDYSVNKTEPGGLEKFIRMPEK